MTPERYQRVRELFEAALDRDTSEWPEFLEGACADDPTLRSEVESLLRAHNRASQQFLNVPLFDRATRPHDKMGPEPEPPSSGDEGDIALATTFVAGEIVAGRYRTVRFLARGGMGEVYEAEDLELGGRIAIKTVRGVTTDPVALGRLKREISLSRRVTHPNVCRVFDLFQHRSADGDVIWLFTMELLAGETLAQRLARGGAMSTTEALPIVSQVVSALEAAHRAGVVHRDLKPSNIQFASAMDGTDSLRAVVTDFGLARSEVGDSHGERSLTASYTLLGTPSYMAPEQVRGEKATTATDVYSLGILVYEMVTGQLPFRGDNQIDLALKRLVTPPTPPRMHVPELSRAWEAAILRCLEREPGKRFVSGGEFLIALRSNGSVASAGALSRYRILENRTVTDLGETHVAEDTQRNRRVLLKVLPPDYRQRELVERRAMSLAMVRHPGVTSFVLDDLGGAPVMVIDCPPGSSLTAHPAPGCLGLPGVLSLGVELCRAVGAAHEQGLVHGALALDQILVDERGGVHVKGFGLAGLFTEDPAGTSAPQNAPHDKRSDIHAIGAMIERLAGDEADLPHSLTRLIAWCKESDPLAQPQSAFDLGHQLNDIGADLKQAAIAATRSGRRRAWLAVTALLVVISAAALSWFLGESRVRPLPYFQRLTYQRGEVEAARFGPDGQTVFYSARWEGAAPEVFTIRPQVSEPLALGIQDASLMAVGETELRLLLHPRRTRDGFLHFGTLVRAAITGGTVRPMREGVVRADFVGAVEAWTNLTRFEFPTGSGAGTEAGLSAMRISPDGKHIALSWYGKLAVAEAGSGQRRVLVDKLYHATGIAWGPDGREVWLSRVERDQGTAIVAYDLTGHEREVYRAPGRLALLDVAPDGRALVATFTLRREVMGGTHGEPGALDLTWLGDSCPIDLTPDGRTLLLHDNTTGSIFGTRGMDGSAPLKLGVHFPSGFTADGKHVLVQDMDFPCRLVEVAIGAGEERILDVPGLDCEWPEQIEGGYVIQARPAGGDAETNRLWRVSADGAQSTPITPEGWEVPALRNVSPDGRWVFARAVDREPPQIAMFEVMTGASRALDQPPPGTAPQGWSTDGLAIFALERDGVPAKLFKMDVATGKSEPWLLLSPGDAAGVESIQEVVLSLDGEHYAYSYFRTLSELYLVTGLR